MSEAENTETVVCRQCEGTGREWFTQGGPHGIGQHSRCGKCDGTGSISRFYEVACGGCDERTGHPHPVVVDRLIGGESPHQG